MIWLGKMILFIPKKSYSFEHMMIVFSEWHKNHIFFWFGFKQKKCFIFFFCRKHSPINLILFLLSSNIFSHFRSYNLWLIVWIFVIVFWLRKSFFLNFNNIIFFYQCNSLTRVLWAQNDMGSCVVIDDFFYISQREVSIIATIKEGRFNYLFTYPFTHYRRIFRVRNIFIFYTCIYRYAYFL